MHTAERSGIGAAAGRWVMCVSSVVALGAADILNSGATTVPGHSVATSAYQLLTTSSGSSGMPADSGSWAGQSVVLPSGNTVNFPFGGVGQNIVLGGGNGGNGGDGLGTALTHTGGLESGTVTLTAAMGNQPVLPIGEPTALSNESMYLIGAGNTLVFPSANTVNLPFGGVGVNNFGGGGTGGTGGGGTGLADIGALDSGTSDNADTLTATATTPTPPPLWNTAVYLPGSGNTTVYPSGNTINFPLGGVGVNNFGGGGNGGAAGESVSGHLIDAGTHADAPATVPAALQMTTELGSAAANGSTLANITIVLSGAYETVVLPVGNTVNFPFGGVGETNFFGPGLAGTAGIDQPVTDTTTAGSYTITTPLSQFTLPFLNATIVLPGSKDTIVLPHDNTVNLPFFGNDDINLFGLHFSTSFDDPPVPDLGTALAGPGGDLPSTMSNTVVFLPGSGNITVLPAYNTINLPLGGVGVNNFFGAGNGGNGPGAGNGGAGPFGAPGGSGYPADVGHTGGPIDGSSNSTDTGIGIDGLGGDGGIGVRFFPVHIMIGTDSVGTTGAGTTAGSVTADLGGAHDATGIGIGGNGGSGGGGLELFPIYLIQPGAQPDAGGVFDPFALADLLSGANNGADGATGIGLGANGGLGGDAAQLFPLYFYWPLSGDAAAVEPALSAEWTDFTGLGDKLTAFFTDVESFF